MTAEELLKFVPHPKRCMATEFDSQMEEQCKNPRSVSYLSWFPWVDIVSERSIKVHLCLLHDTYRRNGGNQLGPVILRAAAEILQSEKRAKSASSRGRSVSKRRSS